MGIQIGAKPDSGFDDPIGMLKDCHRRIEHFLHILCVVVERAHGRESDHGRDGSDRSGAPIFSRWRATPQCRRGRVLVSAASRRMRRRRGSRRSAGSRTIINTQTSCTRPWKICTGSGSPRKAGGGRRSSVIFIHRSAPASLPGAHPDRGAKGLSARGTGAVRRCHRSHRRRVSRAEKMTPPIGDFLDPAARPRDLQ